VAIRSSADRVARCGSLENKFNGVRQQLARIVHCCLKAKGSIMPGMPKAKKHLSIGALVFPKVDQSDFTGPFEVLSRIPGSTFHVIGKDRNPVRDVHGLDIDTGNYV
jgi:hypothetical protein